MKLIHKMAAIVIKDDKFFLVRKKGKDIWTSLGGRIEEGETEEQCLLREIKEEVNCGAKILKKLGDFEDKAIFDPDSMVRLSTYLVELEGTIDLIDPELEECGFIDKEYHTKGIKIPPSLQKQIIPFCINEGLLKW
jgi:8-oxo-dGTP diphosphatase